MKDVIGYIKRHAAPIAVIFIATYALYLRLLKLYRHRLWADEMYQLGQMTGSFLDLLKELPKHEVCSYLSGDFYLIYPFFKIFSFNKWGLAIPHIIVTTLGFYLLYLLCKRYFKTVWGYVVTFIIVCFNVNLVAHATEIRAYAVLPTMALASLYLMQLLVDCKFRISAVKKIWIGIFFVILIWFHVYGLIIFFSTTIAALISMKNIDEIKVVLKRMLKFAVIILIISIPFWLYCSYIGPRGELKENSFKMSVNDWIPSPIANPIGFMKAVFGNLVGFKKLYILLLGATLPFIMPLKGRFRMILYFISAVALPIAVIYVLDVTCVYFFVPRQFVWVIPLFAIHLGWTWDSFSVFLKTQIKRNSAGRRIA